MIHRALDRLESYLDSQQAKAAAVRRALASREAGNPRQIDVLERAHSDPGAVLDARTVARTHRVSEEAARRDLLALEDAGLLVRGKVGRRHVWRATPEVENRILSGQH